MTNPLLSLLMRKHDLSDPMQVLTDPRLLVEVISNPDTLMQVLEDRPLLVAAFEGPHVSLNRYQVTLLQKVPPVTLHAILKKTRSVVVMETVESFMGVKAQQHLMQALLLNPHCPLTKIERLLEQGEARTFALLQGNKLPAAVRACLIAKHPQSACKLRKLSRKEAQGLRKQLPVLLQVHLLPHLPEADARRVLKAVVASELLGLPEKERRHLLKLIRQSSALHTCENQALQQLAEGQPEHLPPTTHHLRFLQ